MGMKMSLHSHPISIFCFRKHCISFIIILVFGCPIAQWKTMFINLPVIDVRTTARCKALTQCISFYRKMSDNWHGKPNADKWISHADEKILLLDAMKCCLRFGFDFSMQISYIHLRIRFSMINNNFHVPQWSNSNWIQPNYANAHNLYMKISAIKLFYKFHRNNQCSIHAIHSLLDLFPKQNRIRH